MGLPEEAVEQVLRLNSVELDEAERRAEEAFHQLSDAQQRLARAERAREMRGELGRYRPRDADLVARLIDPDMALEQQIAALKKQSPYLFQDGPAQAGGAEPTVAPREARASMNQILMQFRK